MSLLAHIEAVADPRSRRGIRHPVASLLKAVLLGLLAGQTCPEHIAAYIAQNWDEVNEPLGFRHWHAPDGETFRRILCQTDRTALSRAFENWVSEILADRTFDVAVDGKACRGVASGDKPAGKALQILNVFVHDIQVVLTQWVLPDKQGEPTVLRENLSALVQKHPHLRLFTGDAAFSGRNLCEDIRQLRKDYLVRIKGNQPDVEEALALWFEERAKTQPRPDARTTEKKRPDPDARIISV